MLAMGAAVWFWGENRELRGRMEERANSSAQVTREASGSTNTGRPAEPKAATRRQDLPDQSKAPRPAPEPRSGTRPFHKVSTGTPGVQQPEATVQKRSATGNPRSEEKAQAPRLIDSGKPAEVVAVSAVEAEKNGESLFKNGGFDKELTPWTAKEGRIVNEPGNPSNSVLEITPKDGAYSLSQDFQRSPAGRELHLTFRMMGAQDDSSGISIALVGKDGKERTVYVSMPKRSTKWAAMDINIPLSGPSRPAGLSIKGSSAKDPLWIDDVVLREVASTSFAPGQ